MEKTFKNIILAGIGTLAYGYEKGTALIEELVKKGEISVDQGKELTEELKQKLDKASEAGADTYRDIISGLKLASKDEFEELKREIDELKARISKLENQ